jgi:GNAT superfamily N-acetyltransferase
VVSERVDQARSIVEADGVVTDNEWQRYRDSLVPDGLFAILDRESSEWVGCIGASHNPAATRFYFPGGGELGYLVLLPAHRRRGLGSALIATAIRRLNQGGYRHIFLGVQGWRLLAIRSYLRAGFRPFLHAPGLGQRWKSVFAALGSQPRAEWPTALPEFADCE